MDRSQEKSRRALRNAVRARSRRRKLHWARIGERWLTKGLSAADRKSLREWTRDEAHEFVGPDTRPEQ